MDLERLFVQIAYIAAAACFILALKWMGHPSTARRAVYIGEAGMVIAVVSALLHHDIVSYRWIAAAFVVGTSIGVPLAVLMPMTAVPQRTALSHAFGSLAAALVGTADYVLHSGHLSAFTMGALAFETILGFLTFTGSLMAFGKLQEILPGRPLVYRGQLFVNFAILATAAGLGVALVVDPSQTMLFPPLIVLSLLFGILLILPIGGADMPTVIALLNSYAGLAASAMGFVLDNKLLIVAGALDGASGFTLAVIMCKAMNR